VSGCLVEGTISRVAERSVLEHGRLNNTYTHMCAACIACRREGEGRQGCPGALCRPGGFDNALPATRPLRIRYLGPSHPLGQHHHQAVKGWSAPILQLHGAICMLGQLLLSVARASRHHFLDFHLYSAVPGSLQTCRVLILGSVLASHEEKGHCQCLQALETSAHRLFERGAHRDPWKSRRVHFCLPSWIVDHRSSVLTINRPADINI
jgi:hypothetical protein